jgi:hypothetical protein
MIMLLTDDDVGTEPKGYILSSKRRGYSNLS